jgi:SPP1 gp7 family putative phage head morphogenesis protein
MLLLRTVGVASFTKQEEDDVLDRGEFTESLAALALLLHTTLRPSEESAMVELRRILDRDWANIGGTARDEALKRAAAVVANIPADKQRELLQQLQGGAIQMERRAREAAVQQGVDAPRQLSDAEVAAATERVSQTPEAIEGEYARRGEVFAKTAAVIIAAGIAAGLSREEIVERLTTRAARAAQAPEYIQGVSAATLNRARAGSLFTTYQRAGADIYEVSAVLDERTCAKCRFMDGKRFSLSSAQALMDRASEAGTVADLAEVNPFLREGRDADGNKIIFYVRGGERVNVATVSRDATGTADDAGEFAGDASEQELTDAGIGPPPYHPRCRCMVTLVA